MDINTFKELITSTAESMDEFAVDFNSKVLEAKSTPVAASTVGYSDEQYDEDEFEALDNSRGLKNVLLKPGSQETFPDPNRRSDGVRDGKNDLNNAISSSSLEVDEADVAAIIKIQSAARGKLARSLVKNIIDSSASQNIERIEDTVSDG